MQYKPYPSPGQGTLGFLRRLQFDFSNLVIWNAVAGCLPPLLHTPFYIFTLCTLCTFLPFYPPWSVTPFAEFGCKVLRRCWWLVDQITLKIAIWVSVAVMIVDRLCVNWQVTLKSGFGWVRKLGILPMLFGGLIMLGVIFVATVIRAVRGRTHAAHTEQPHQEYKTTQEEIFSFPFWNIRLL